MKRENDLGTKLIVFDVHGVGGPAATVKLVGGGRPYLWLGAPNNGACLGTIEGRELRNLARAILREIDSQKQRPQTGGEKP